MSQFNKPWNQTAAFTAGLMTSGPAWWSWAANNSGIILNISEGGMAVLVAEDLNGHGIGNLRFQAPEFEHWIETAAEIAWISDSRKQVGICFKGLSEAARTQLRAGISIATTRARLATQVNQGGTATMAEQEQTDPTTPSSPPRLWSIRRRLSSPNLHTPPTLKSNAPAGKIVEKLDEDEAHAQVSNAASARR